MNKLTLLCIVLVTFLGYNNAQINNGLSPKLFDSEGNTCKFLFSMEVDDTFAKFRLENDITIEKIMEDGFMQIWPVSSIIEHAILTNWDELLVNIEIDSKVIRQGVRMKKNNIVMSQTDEYTDFRKMQYTRVSK